MANASRTSGRSSTKARSSYPSDQSHRRAFVNSYRRFKTPVYIRSDSVIQRLTKSSVLQLSYRQKTANPALRRCSHDLLHSQKEPACRGCDPTPTLATSELALAN